nr:PREDICTED: hypermethylated in cancer 1 protein-like [Bemisia tabaci]
MKFPRYVLFIFVSSFLRHDVTVLSSPDWDNAVTAYENASAQCREITDESPTAVKLAAAQACEQAFVNLDMLALNLCLQWRKPKCRQLPDEPYYQCSIKNPSCAFLEPIQRARTLYECAYRTLREAVASRSGGGGRGRGRSGGRGRGRSGRRGRPPLSTQRSPGRRSPGRGRSRTREETGGPSSSGPRSPTSSLPPTPLHPSIPDDHTLEHDPLFGIDAYSYGSPSRTFMGAGQGSTPFGGPSHMTMGPPIGSGSRYDSGGVGGSRGGSPTPSLPPTPAESSIPYDRTLQHDPSSGVGEYSQWNPYQTFLGAPYGSSLPGTPMQPSNAVYVPHSLAEDPNFGVDAYETPSYGQGAYSSAAHQSGSSSQYQGAGGSSGGGQEEEAEGENEDDTDDEGGEGSSSATVAQGTPQECPKCQKIYTNPRSFKSHLRTHEWVRQGKYRCTECNENLSSKPNLRHHMRRWHNKELPSEPKPYKCDYPNCNKEYTTSRNLTVHKQSHTNVFVCPYCGAELRLRNSFLQHTKHCPKRPS